jgi:hypothetical protein
LDSKAQERIKSLGQANSDLREQASSSVPVIPYEDVVRGKIIEEIKTCSLDGLRVIKHVYTNAPVLGEELKNKFGEAPVENAERSMLIEKTPTWVTRMGAEPVETCLYSIRDEYKTMLGDLLSERE